MSHDELNGVEHPGRTVEEMLLVQLAEALRAVLELGRKDTSNPKYDGVFEDARYALAKSDYLTKVDGGETT